mgnify:CR=1 FL=1
MVNSNVVQQCVCACVRVRVRAQHASERTPVTQSLAHLVAVQLTRQHFQHRTSPSEPAKPHGVSSTAGVYRAVERRAGALNRQAKCCYTRHSLFSCLSFTTDTQPPLASQQETTIREYQRPSISNTNCPARRRAPPHPSGVTAARAAAVPRREARCACDMRACAAGPFSGSRRLPFPGPRKAMQCSRSGATPRRAAWALWARAPPSPAAAARPARHATGPAAAALTPAPAAWPAAPAPPGQRT